MDAQQIRDQQRDDIAQGRRCSERDSDHVLGTLTCEFCRNVTMMTTPDAWPMWPWLPVKRRNHQGFPDTAIIAEDNRELFTIRKWDGLRPSNEVLMTYPTAEDAVRDGWVVD